MKTHLIHGTRPELVICFLGWGAQPQMLTHLAREERSLLFCWDYTTIAPLTLAKKWRAVYLVAWSLGVWVAQESAQHLPLQAAIAINGTPRPIHPNDGIAPAIFAATVANLTPATREKFIQRMAGDRATLAALRPLMTREFSDVKQELIALERHITHRPPAENLPWSKAWIADTDRIFPTAAQQHFWGDNGREIAGGHFPFFQFQRWSELWTQ